MAPVFNDWDVTVIALSNDTVARAKFHKNRDGLSFPLLADPNLEVISQMGLRHDKAIGFHTFFLFGLPMGYPNGFRSMAIPTSVLLDEEGVVRWIDQALDYRIRGDADRVLAGLTQAYGAKPATAAPA